MRAAACVPPAPTVLVLLLLMSPALLLLQLPAVHAKKLAPEALPSPLSGLNNVGRDLELSSIHDSRGGLGGAWSQVWMGDRQPLMPSPRMLDGVDQVDSTVGGSAFLPCSVQHLGDRTVTWMRQRDLHILTAGDLTYSADERFRVLHPDNTPDWTLHIKVVTPRDAGLYECQVNSDPKLSRVVALKVKEPSQLDDPGIPQTTNPRYYEYYDYEEDPAQDPTFPHNGGRKPSAKGRRPFRKCWRGRRGRNKTAAAPTVNIEGPAERYIQDGSVLALTCLVTHQKRRAPAHLLWFKGHDRLDYNSPRGGVSVQTEKMASRTVSRLMISEVRTQHDSGEYACSPTDLPTAVVVVHVQKGQHHAAVHQSVYNSCPHLASQFTTILLLLLPLLLLGLWSPILVTSDNISRRRRSTAAVL